MRALVLAWFLLPLAASAQSWTDPQCAANAMCAARAAESPLRQRGRAERHDGTLVLIVAQGRRLSFTDNKQACQADDTQTCAGYALMGNFPKSHALVLQKFHAEGSDYILIDDRDGRQTRLNGMPVFSPGGDRFLVAPFSDAGDVGSNNLEIWRRGAGGAVMEWAHPFRQAYAEDPALPSLYQSRVVRWDKDRITLALATEGDGRHWSGTLAHAADGWHLSAKSPPGLFVRK